MKKTEAILQQQQIQTNPKEENRGKILNQNYQTWLVVFPLINFLFSIFYIQTYIQYSFHATIIWNSFFFFSISTFKSLNSILKIYLCTYLLMFMLFLLLFRLGIYRFHRANTGNIFLENTFWNNSIFDRLTIPKTYLTDENLLTTTVRLSPGNTGVAK